MVQTPLRQREIVIVFDPDRLRKTGRLKKSEKKAETSAESTKKQEAKP